MPLTIRPADRAHLHFFGPLDLADGDIRNAAERRLSIVVPDISNLGRDTEAPERDSGRAVRDRDAGPEACIVK